LFSLAAVAAALLAPQHSLSMLRLPSLSLSSSQKQENFAEKGQIVF